MPQILIKELVTFLHSKRDIGSFCCVKKTQPPEYFLEILAVLTRGQSFGDMIFDI
jgi:hypothetical protein